MHKNSNSEKLIIEWMLHSFLVKPGTINLTDKNGPDWNKICITANKIGLNSRINEILTPLNLPNIIPENIQNSFTTARILAIQRNLALLEEYKQIWTRLKSRNIPVQAIKGLWILQQPELHGLSRITSDIDLLVDREKIEQSIIVLRNLGYTQDPSRSRFDSKINYKSGHHLIPFRKNGISVEIHFKALPESAQEFNNDLIRQSNLRDHFSVILLHFIRHKMNGDPQLKWLADILRIIPFLNADDFPFINQTIKKDYNADIASELLDILINLRKYKTPCDQADEILSLLKGSKNQPTNNLRSLMNKIPKGISGIRFICAGIFPRQEYLRFIYPRARRYPVFLLYPFRWYQLSRKLSSLSLKIHR